MTYHLAHVNIAWMHAAVHEEEMSGFAARIDEINALAEHSPGFVGCIMVAPRRHPPDDRRLDRKAAAGAKERSD